MRVAPSSLLAPWSALALTLTVASCRAPKAPTPAVQVRPLPERVTGANLRAVGDHRRGYGTAKARETMKRLQDLGVNTVSILMEGRMDNVEDLDVRTPDPEDLEDIRAALADAHQLGLATVLIPHLYLDDGAWRGRIRHPDPQRRDEWWASYTDFIVAAADLARDTGTSLLSIGVELKGMSQEVDTRTRMKQLCERIRQRGYKGKLTYNANWDEAENVRFWDLVDAVGVNGYYPLLPEPVRGAEKVALTLTKLHEQSQRPVLILEVGYRASPMSHVRPWEWPEAIDGSEVDEQAQSHAWAAILSYWLGARGVQGLLVWVIPTDPDDPASEPAHGFNPLNRSAEEVIRRAFLDLELG